MQTRYRVYRRANGVFYVKDKITRQSESLATSNKMEAHQLLAAKNQAVLQPQLNRAMAKTYLMAKSPELVTRTWTDVMEQYVKAGVESTRERKERAFKSRPFTLLRNLTLMDTEAVHLLAALEHRRAGNSTHHYLRRLHNYALHLGWLLAPVMADAAWPPIRSKKMLALNEEEHRQIVARERNEERRLYYEMLWETGGAQSDIAQLHWDRIDRKAGTISFTRQKLEGQGGGQSNLCMGQKIQAILD